ncbi:hypothetical protein FDT66_08315 [Polaribacter aestuariivivens]|uniref:Carboxypeptidase regulatory-like domain-containing protein n=1 Tax=Polaribacter aestuariivivens TaxID=2304626 RepID=A0A5S3N424_9FLAO|nr:hypothetical protein [Polaribacter aestuariivivens]TMM29867.1 hypothetical protein FDT66_08315 [Polaribacter aestuariivivens]
MTKHLNFRKIILFSLFILSFSNINSQNKSNIIENSFSEEETVYVHLNKSTYIKGEHIGFTAYVFNKNTKVLSSKTSNLYCTLSDKKNKTIKSKLIKVSNGIASGNFILDDSLNAGNYIFKAYTSWMLNFEAKNYFVEKITVLDNKTPQQIDSNTVDIDAQLLPESGTLLYNTTNTIGVIVKDKFGNGVPNIKGVLLENNKVIRTFNLNKLGIGRFSFLLKKGNSYNVTINHLNKKTSINLLQTAKEKGVVLQVSKVDQEAFISINTNNRTLKEINDKTYFLKINSNLPKSFKLNFDKNNSIKRVLQLKKLPKGVNTIALLNENRLVVAERLFFNYHGLEISKVTNFKTEQNKDTISTTLTLSDINKLTDGNVSVSILPEKTKSYIKQHNIISQTLIQPYVKSFVEDGGYYFKDINNEKKHHLDNLLITQGWSSHNWPNEKKEFIYPFENGINIKLNIPNSGKKGSYLVHHTSNKGSRIIEYDEPIKAIQLKGYYPEGDKNLYVSSMNKKGIVSKPNALYAQFFPAIIPSLNITYSLKQNNSEKNNSYDDYFKFYAQNKITKLDEVIIKANKREKEIEDLRKKTMGRLFVLNKIERNMPLSIFLNEKPGVFAFDNFEDGTFTAINTRDKTAIAVYLDGFLVQDSFTLFNYFLYDVEYIDVNLNDFSGGLRLGPGGAVRIKTNPLLNYKEKETAVSLVFPVTFSESKKFYEPKYTNYKNNFFKNYGVVSWLPKNAIDNNKIYLEFKKKEQNKVNLFIEGVTNNGTFISEKIIVDLK